MRILDITPDGYTYICIVTGGISIYALQIKLFLLVTWRALSLSNWRACLH